MGCVPSSDSNQKKQAGHDGQAPQREEQVPKIEEQEEEIVAFAENTRKNNRVADEDYDPKEVQGEETAVAAFNSALIVAPSKPPALISAAPKANYVPNYAYGYRGYDSRQNLFFNPDGSLVYPLATLGIVMNPTTNTQLFFGGKALGKGINQHDDDILCLNITNDGKRVATGQVGVKPKVFIWNSQTGEYVSKYVLTEKNVRGVIACAFSRNGQYLAFVDLSDNHSVYVIEVASGKLLWSKPSGKSEIYGISWGKDKEFAICGKSIVKFWNVDTQEVKSGTGLDPQTMSCIAYDDQERCHVSAVNGTIYVLEGHKVVKKIEKAHAGKITALLFKEGKLISAGDDKKVVFRKKEDDKVIFELSCENIPRAVDVKGNMLVVGDGADGITLYDGSTKVDTWKGHHEGEVWGLDVTDKYIITTGDDNKIIIWDYKARKAISVGSVNAKAGEKLKGNASTKSKLPDIQCARAVAYNAKTNEIAITI